jgi:exopolyphosphatase/guanosine-5'-triphosphate,3'-diphosphate pyrophosphatase
MALEVYDRSLVHGHRLAVDTIYGIRDTLVLAGPGGRKGIPGLQPARSDIILAGVRILIQLMDFLDIGEIVVSEADLMYGLALEAAKSVGKNININNQN